MPNNRNSPVSHFSSQAIVTQIIAHRKDLPSKGLPTREHPLVHLPTLLSSVYELFGVTDHYSAEDQSKCNVLTFPAANFLYNQETWSITPLVAGVEVHGVPNTYLYANRGLTPFDRTFIGNQFVRGLSIDDIYRYVLATGYQRNRS